MFPEALAGPARELFGALATQPLIAGYYLAGGSAIALHLGHRVSVDLDFFTSGECDPDGLLGVLQRLGRVDTVLVNHATLHAVVNGTHVSFFAYPYPLLDETESVRGIRVAGLLDLALMKVIAVSQRGKRRDFVDLFCVCRSGYELPLLLRRLHDKYPGLGDPGHDILPSLTYFEDAEEDPPLQMLEPCDWGEVKAFFVREARRLAG